MRPVTLALVAMLALDSVALAHGGGLNKSGCHTNKRTGNYHCHRAQPPPPRPAPTPDPAPKKDKPDAGTSRR